MENQKTENGTVVSAVPNQAPAQAEAPSLMVRVNVALDQPITYRSALKGVGYVAAGVAAYELTRFVVHKATNGSTQLPGLIKYKPVAGAAGEGTVIPIKAAR